MPGESLWFPWAFFLREPKDSDRKKTKKSHISFRHSVISSVHTPMSGLTRKALFTPPGVRFSQELFNARGALMVSPGIRT